MALYKAIRRLASNALQDFRYGGFLGGVKRTPFAASGAYDTANSDYQALSLLFYSVRHRIQGHSALVDVGCGKGRVLNFWLSEFPGKSLYGIELDGRVAEDTARRLASHHNVRILHGDARELIPPEATFFYMFNPFNGHVMADFVARLRASPQAVAGRTIEILYYNPAHIEAFPAESIATLSPVILPEGFHKAFLIQLA